MARLAVTERAVAVRLAGTLGVMQADLVDRLLQSTSVELDALDQWQNANRFFYEALCTVKERLPTAVQEQLAKLGSGPASAGALEAARVELWNSIAEDQMGNTPEGSATRAALFAFFPQGTDGPLDSIAYFCNFFQRAGLGESALAEAFHRQWPPKNDA